MANYFDYVQSFHSSGHGASTLEFKKNRSRSPACGGQKCYSQVLICSQIVDSHFDHFAKTVVPLGDWQLGCGPCPSQYYFGIVSTSRTANCSRHVSDG